eukprot:SM000278S10006  [mRNA]  locus=s278:124878:125951:+ [translate_table: standard]
MFVLPDADHPDFLLHFVDEGYTQEQALEVPPDSGHGGIFPDAVAALTKQQWVNVSAAYKSVVTFVATHPAVVAVALLAQAAIAVYYFMVLAIAWVMAAPVSIRRLRAVLPKGYLHLVPRWASISSSLCLLHCRLLFLRDNLKAAGRSTSKESHEDARHY